MKHLKRIWDLQNQPSLSLSKQENKINKIRDPFTNKWSSNIIHKIFRDYYEDLYSHLKTVDEAKIRRYLSTLDLPSLDQYMEMS